MTSVVAALERLGQDRAVGAYAGVAAVLGLAVLSLLYFAPGARGQAPARMGRPRARARRRARGSA